LGRKVGNLLLFFNHLFINRNWFPFPQALLRAQGWGWLKKKLTGEIFKGKKARVLKPRFLGEGALKPHKKKGRDYLWDQKTPFKERFWKGPKPLSFGGFN